MGACWAKIEFIMPTDNDYTLMKYIAQKFYDNELQWAVKEYNPENLTISIEELTGSQEDVIEFATELIEVVLKRLLSIASDGLKKLLIILHIECTVISTIHIRSVNSSLNEMETNLR